MSTVIKIFNPSEKPYGWLSNDYRFFIRIDDEEWSSVTGYAYANILNTPLYKQTVRKTNIKSIRDTFNQLYNKEKNETVKMAIERALKVKFSNEKLAQLLISTGNAPIIYVSGNPFMGVGIDGSGMNEYGKSLEQIRHVLRVAFKEEKRERDKAQKDQELYDTYLANKGLLTLMQEGIDIKEFMGKSASEIVNTIGREKLVRISPKRDFILLTIHKGGLPNIVKYSNNIDSMIMQIRKNEIRKLRTRKIKKRKEIVFDMYADYLLKKNFDLEPEQYAKAKAQQFNSLGLQQKSELENKLFDFYEKGMLSERLSTNIDEALSAIIIPTEDEVEETENIVISFSDRPKANDEPYIPTNGNPVLVYAAVFDGMKKDLVPYVDFSPISLTGMLNIDDYMYPTVTHYIVVKLIASLPTDGGKQLGIKSAYSAILSDSESPVTGIASFVDPNEAYNRYEQLSLLHISKALKYNSKIALDAKFQNRVMQDILLSTGDSKLLWNDRNEPILGVGSKGNKGENFVGNYLMDLRRSIRSERKGEQIDKITTKDIEQIVNSDIFVKNWLEMRIRDVCKVLVIMKNYLEVQFKKEVTLNKEFTERVLDIVYQPCSGIYGAVDLVKVEIPLYFSKIVLDSLKPVQKAKDTEDIAEMKELSVGLEEVSRVVWKRIVVMLYFLNKHMKDSTISTLRIMLAKLEFMVSKKVNCVKYVDDEFDNCIISALLNLITGLSEFKRQYGYSDKIVPRDVAVAISIILNTDMITDLKPSQTSKPKLGKEVAKEVAKETDKLETDIYDIEEDEEELVFDADDGAPEGEDDEDEKEIEGYDEGEFSPKMNMVIARLVEMEIVDEPEELSSYIESAIDVVKATRMSSQTKRNRINFFATQR
jgi:predicted NAD-dependent protein-ADP-ribosyltransferase YbiA (DUF1768 family)